LLERAKAQDPEAWRRLIDLYGPLVYYWCRQQHLGPEDMADVFQEVFRAVARHLPTFRKDRAEDSFRGWLLTITKNKIRDHFRRQKGQPVAAGGSDAARQLEQVPEPLSDLDEAAGSEQHRRLLHRALDLIRGEFTEATWQAFWRATVEGHFPADIAADLGISVNAVYKAKARVLHRLRTELGDLIV
jgi:RNA polymerase sigma-70 factor (ECF subfamily)